MGIRHNLLCNSLIFPQMFIGHMCLVFCEVVLYIFCPFFPVIPFALFLQIYSSSLYILDTNPLLVICIVITSFFFQFVTYLFLHSVCQISFCHFLPSFHLPSFNTINCPQNKPTWHSLVPYFLMYLHFGSHDFKEPSVKHLLVFHWWTNIFKYLGEF